MGCVRCVPRKRAEIRRRRRALFVGARSRMRAPARRTRRRRCSTGHGQRRRIPRCLTEILSLSRPALEGSLRSVGRRRSAPRSSPAARAPNTSPPMRCGTIPSPASTRRRCRCCWASALRRAIWRERSLRDSRRSLRHGAAGITRPRARRSSCSRQLDRATEHYATAYAQAPDGAGSVASMRRQVSLLARALPEAAIC